MEEEEQNVEEKKVEEKKEEVIPEPVEEPFELDPEYKTLLVNSISPQTMEKFWDKEANQILWFKKPKQTVDLSNPPFAKWFPDGILNMCYNCLDRHIEEGFGDNNAIIWENTYDLPSETWTYKELYKEVNKLAYVLLHRGIKKGDRVIIFLPLIPQSFVALLACWRIGAISVVIFGGFAAGELAEKIQECQPSVIITASAGIEPKKKVVYLNTIDSALSKIEKNGFNSQIQLYLIQRKNVQVLTPEEINKISEKHSKTLTIYDYNKDVKSISVNVKVECAQLEANSPLYILFTSGTSGSAKGVVRDLAGCAVTANFTMSKIMNLNRGDISFNTSDIGWIVGQLFMVYGPLIRGATSLFMEGKPIGTPDCSVCFNIIQKYKPKIFYTCPTVLRMYKLEDPNLKIISKFDISSLETLAISGERCDKETYEWAQQIVGKKVLINDHWWQTESGYPICCNNINIKRFPCTPGITGYPMLGFDLHLLDEETKEEINVTIRKGLACIKYPTPPSFMSTFYQNDEAFKAKFSKIGEDLYYETGDLAEWTVDGGIHILSRNDDMIKVCGHRLSSGKIEEVVCGLKEVNQCGIVGMKDEIKGEVPFAFCVVNNGVNLPFQELTNKVNDMISSQIGGISRILAAITVEDLPKNKSGKIVRAILKKICNKEDLTNLPTIENPESVDKVKASYDAYVTTMNKIKKKENKAKAAAAAAAAAAAKAKEEAEAEK